MKYFSLLFLIIPCLLSAQDTSKTFIFGHSLIDHRPPAIATPSNETTVPHWIFLLAQEAGYPYAAGGQYGFLPQHANVPPISQWGYDIVPGVWESDTEPFSEADIDQILITAGNFMQWQDPSLPYPGEPVTLTPISATLSVVDWVNQQEDSLQIYIYENWPDMAPYLTGGNFPPTGADLDDYYSYTAGDFHDWWIAYHDSVLAARPDVKVRMIPVGPIFAQLFQSTPYDQIPATELYEDDAPHGRASLYFVASLVTYMAMFQEKAPATFSVPSIVHPVIQNNYTTLVDTIWDALLAFNAPSGESRVFFSSPATSTDPTIADRLCEVFPNPTANIIHIESLSPVRQVSIYNQAGQLVLQRQHVQQVSLKTFPTGSYEIVIEDITGQIFSHKIIKNE